MSEYYSFAKYCDPDVGYEGYYAIPTTFNDFDPKTGEVILPHQSSGEDATETYTPDDFVFLDDDEETAYRVLAVRLHEEDFTSTVTAGYKTIDIGSTSYSVLTDEEADDAWDDELERYIDECLSIPSNIEPYFDREGWKRDARIDGRGHTLSCYDGEEHDVSTEVGTFYLYQS